MPDTSIRTLPVLPLSTGVVFPGMVVTLALETDEARAAVDAAGDQEEVLLVPRQDSSYASVGTIARVEGRMNLPNGQRALVVRGIARARVGSGVVGRSSALWVEATPLDTTPSDRTDELAREYRAAAKVLLESLGGRRLTGALADVDEPDALADTVAWLPELTYERKVELLEIVDVDARLETATTWVKEALAEMSLAEKIRDEVSDGMESRQREFLLRQQLAAIRKELGEDGAEDPIEEYRQKLAERDLPEDVVRAVERELDRLERGSEQSPEQGWIRTWLDTVFELPWDQRTEDDLDLAKARAVLDADHTGLDEVKDRVIEFLAVRKLLAERQSEREAEDVGIDGEIVDDATTPRVPGRDGRRSGAIVALVGPPGVGKTSLGESVARALGRSFVRVALGGVRDESEIRGHRRTYVGAQPGRIVRALTEAGSMNPVVLLDEIDKVGSDWRGDPSSALLEVLDPAQNHTFRDHYLEIDLDLSDVLFVATANVLDSIPGPLLDRLEIVRLDGYTEDEKVSIARDHLLERQATRNGLRDGEVTVTEDALQALVAGWTREPGVRELERQLGKLLRKAATRIATGERGESSDGDAPEGTVIGPDELGDLLGRARFDRDEELRPTGPGVARGLAVTGAGGETLVIEATATPGDAGLEITGQLGDVMQESARIARTWVLANQDDLDLEPGATERRLHLHVPAGAVPKDGPSAGVTMTTALVSLLSGRPVRPEVGMTGEVTLQGRVLPIGGVKQKVLAAHRAGLTEVILPARNGPDVDDVPEAVREVMTFHLADHVDQVLDIALMAEPEAQAAQAA